MSLKMNFLYAHLDFFLPSCETSSNENGEKFDVMEHGYWKEGMLADAPELSYMKQAKRRRSHEATTCISSDTTTCQLFFHQFRTYRMNLSKISNGLSMLLAYGIKIYRFLLIR